jgi:hypothetical protein
MSVIIILTGQDNVADVVSSAMEQIIVEVEVEVEVVEEGVGVDSGT